MPYGVDVNSCLAHVCCISCSPSLPHVTRCYMQTITHACTRRRLPCGSLPLAPLPATGCGGRAPGLLLCPPTECTGSGAGGHGASVPHAAAAAVTAVVTAAVTAARCAAWIHTPINGYSRTHIKHSRHPLPTPILLSPSDPVRGPCIPQWGARASLQHISHGALEIRRPIQHGISTPAFAPSSRSRGASDA